MLETWLYDINVCDMLPNYNGFSLKAKRLNKYGRCSGGIEVFIKHKLVKYFTRIKSNFEHAISFLVDAELFGSHYRRFKRKNKRRA
jgi:hypothetical protein